MNCKKWGKIGGLGLCLSFSLVSAQAQIETALTIANGLYNTGVDNSGNLLGNNVLDSHYVITNYGTGNTYAVNPLAAGWVANTATSRWISLSGGNFNAPSIVYDYNLNLSNIPVGKLVTINGFVAADDNVTISANGQTSHFSNYSSRVTAGNYNSFTTFPAVTFVSGTSNSLLFAVSNNGGSATGLQLQLSGYYTDLTSTVGLGIQFVPVLPLTPNQTAVNNALNAINSVGVSNATFAALTGALVGISDPGFGPALDQLSPEKLAIFSSIAFNNISLLTLDLDDYLAHRRNNSAEVFRTTPGGIDLSGMTWSDPTMDPMLANIQSQLFASTSSVPVTRSDAVETGSAADSLASADHMNFFLRGNAILGQDYGNADNAYTTYTTGSFQLGADYQLTPHFLFGTFFSYSHTDTSLDEMGSNGTVDSYAPGIYASYTDQGWFLNAMGSYSFDNYTENRNIAIGDFGGTAHGAPTGNQKFVYVDGGHDFHNGNWTWGPMTGIQYAHYDMNSFTETGAGGADLSVADQAADSLRSRLGGRVSYATSWNHILFTPHITASWQHEFLDGSRAIVSSFDEVGGAPYAVYTAHGSPDSALADVGLDADLNQTVTLFINYELQAGQSDYFGEMVQVGTKVAF